MNTGYSRIKINTHQYQAHRLAWLYVSGDWPKEQIDHIDGNRSNNIILNLRAASPMENSKNMTLRKTSKNGIYGISKTAKGYWQAKIADNGFVHHLYHGSNFFEACCARKSAEIKYGYHPNHGRRQRLGTFTDYGTRIIEDKSMSYPSPTASAQGNALSPYSTPCVSR